jgi:hypothetical protein
MTDPNDMFAELAIKDSMIFEKSLNEKQAEQIYTVGDRNEDSGKYKVEGQTDSVYANKITNAELTKGDYITLKKNGIPSLDSKPALTDTEASGFSASTQSGNTTLGKRNKDKGYLYGQVFTIPEPEPNPLGNIKYLYSVDVDGKRKYYVAGHKPNTDHLVDEFTISSIPYLDFNLSNLKGDDWLVESVYDDGSGTKYYQSYNRSGKLIKFNIPSDYDRDQRFYGHGYLQLAVKSLPAVSGNRFSTLILMNGKPYYEEGWQSPPDAPFTDRFTNYLINAKNLLTYSNNSAVGASANNFLYGILRANKLNSVFGVGLTGLTASGYYPLNAVDKVTLNKGFQIADIFRQSGSELYLTFSNLISSNLTNSPNRYFLDLQTSTFSHIPRVSEAWGSTIQPRGLFDAAKINAGTQGKIKQNVDIYALKDHKKTRSKSFTVYPPMYQGTTFKMIWASYAE